MLWSSRLAPARRLGNGKRRWGKGRGREGTVVCVAVPRASSASPDHPSRPVPPPPRRAPGGGGGTQRPCPPPRRQRGAGRAAAASAGHRAPPRAGPAPYMERREMRRGRRGGRASPSPGLPADPPPAPLTDRPGRGATVKIRTTGRGPSSFPRPPGSEGRETTGRPAWAQHIHPPLPSPRRTAAPPGPPSSRLAPAAATAPVSSLPGRKGGALPHPPAAPCAAGWAGGINAHACGQGRGSPCGEVTGAGDRAGGVSVSVSASASTSASAGGWVSR